MRQELLSGSKAAPSASGGTSGGTHDAVGGQGGASLPPTIRTSRPVQRPSAPSRGLRGPAGSANQAPGPPASTDRRGASRAAQAASKRRAETAERTARIRDPRSMLFRRRSLALVPASLMLCDRHVLGRHLLRHAAGSPEGLARVGRRGDDRPYCREVETVCAAITLPTVALAVSPIACRASAEPGTGSRPRSVAGTPRGIRNGSRRRTDLRVDDPLDGSAAGGPRRPSTDHVGCVGVGALLCRSPRLSGRSRMD